MKEFFLNDFIPVFIGYVIAQMMIWFYKEKVFKNKINWFFKVLLVPLGIIITFVFLAWFFVMLE